MPSFPSVGFVTTQWATWIMPLLLKYICSNIRSATIVGGKNDQGITRCSALLQRIQQTAHGSIRLHYKISIRVETALVLPLISWGKWGMWCGQCEIEQKWFRVFCSISNKRLRMLGKGRKNVIQLPVLQSRPLFTCQIISNDGYG